MAMGAILVKVERQQATPESDFWVRMRHSLIESCNAINAYFPHAATDEQAFLWSLQQGYRLQIAAIEAFQLPNLKKPFGKISP